MTDSRDRLAPERFEQNLGLERKLLKDQAAEVLRKYISYGRIPGGSRLTERDVSTLLGIGRGPARDALMMLEAEGLVISMPDGRYVREFTMADCSEIMEIRVALEGLAIERAALRMSEDNRAALYAALSKMEEAAAGGNSEAFAWYDITLHRTIWQQGDSATLLRVLDSMLGAIFVLAERTVERDQPGLDRAFRHHRELVDKLAAGDSAGAVQVVMERHTRTLARLREGLAGQSPDQVLSSGSA